MTREIVKVAARNGRLYLEFPMKLSREIYDVSRKRLSLNLEDSPERQKVADAIARSMQADIDLGRFDSTLEKYGLGKAKYQAIAKMYLPQEELGLFDLWDEWVKYKAKTLKVGTLVNYAQCKRYLQRIGDVGAIALRDKLLSITTVQATRRILILLSAAYDWGIKHEKVKSNPYKGMASELPKSGHEVEGKANPFTDDEVERILKAFEESEYYWEYRPLVEFLLLTGCRPSEAIGLRWKHVDGVNKQINFKENITYKNGRYILNKGSKNNKSRYFPISNQLGLLFWQLAPKSGSEKSRDECLVFPAPRGENQPINYNNFSQRAWDRVVDPIKPGTTPYNCRDTFISRQIRLGTPVSVVAKWCDTSTRQIERDYLGIEGLKPL